MNGLLVFILLLLIYSPAAMTHYNKSNKEINCLAEVIYHEARGEPYVGQLAVGQVVLNRVKRKEYPDSICKVMFQKDQFPWTKKWKRFTAPKDFISIANYVISGKHVLKDFKATHFHATYVDPKWKLTKVAIIGNHIFYSL